MTLLVLSPHFDDAVLSCFWAIARHEHPLVVTIFGGVPAAGVATKHDRRMGFASSARAMLARRREHQRAMRELGCESVVLPFLDGQYGGDAPDPADITEQLDLSGIDEVLAPRAGGPRPHSDHALTRAAAHIVAGTPVTLYDDLPYCVPAPPSARLIDDRVLRQKLQALDLYSLSLGAFSRRHLLRPEVMAAERYARETASERSAPT